METSYLSSFIEQYGYLALFFATFLEGMCIFIVSSELVLGFSGYLIYTGHFSLIPVLLAGILGSLSGSVFIYFVSKQGGRQLVSRWGHLVRLNPPLVSKMERWFLRFGPLLIIPWRQVPVIRSKISIISGILNLQFRTFAFFTTIGIIIWTTLAVSIGYHLGNKWLDFVELFRYLAEFIVYIIVLCILSLMLFLYFRKKKQKNIVSKKTHEHAHSKTK